MLQILVLRVHFLKDGLNGELGTGAATKFLKCDLPLFKLLDKRLFAWHKEHQSISFSFVSCCAAHAVNIRIYVFRDIDLHYPVYCGEVYPSRGDVGAKEYCLFFLNKLKVDCSAFVLILFTMKFE